jgi:tetratricopeptide (TPR) repeat protein
MSRRPALVLVPLLVALAGAASPGPVDPAVPAVQDRGTEVSQRYHALAAAGDGAGLAALWQGNPDLVLPVIDADLEGSLKLRESSETPDEQAIAALQARALFGARAAEQASGHPILVDYAASFVGWDAEQQRRFRAGQAAFGRARQAARAADHAAALAAATECRELAEPLGDWWGTAMGLGAEGQALAALGRHEEALVALARARLIHHDLGLDSSAYRNLLDMLDALQALGRAVRRDAVLAQALVQGERQGDAKGVAALRERAAGWGAVTPER